MDDQPNLKLLNRDLTRSIVREHMASQLTALRSLVDFGVNLIDRSFEVAQVSGMAKLIAVGVFLKQVVAMADAVEVLLNEGALYACHLPARGAFEASIYLHYILERDSDARAMRFYVGDLRRQLEGARMAIPGTREAEKLARLDEMTGGPNDRSEMEPLAREQAAGIERELRKPDLAGINAEFDTARRKLRRDPAWYTLEKGLSVHNVRDLSRHLSRLVDYEAFYGRGSAVMHAGTYKDHLDVQGGGKVALVPIRHIGDSHHLLRQVFLVTLGSYHQVILAFASDEAPAARELYLSKWRAAFMDMPELNWDYV